MRFAGWARAHASARTAVWSELASSDTRISGSWPPTTSGMRPSSASMKPSASYATTLTAICTGLADGGQARSGGRRHRRDPLFRGPPGLLGVPVGAAPGRRALAPAVAPTLALGRDRVELPALRAHHLVEVGLLGAGE